MKHKKGFTLVELLAVIAILAIMIVFVAPKLVGVFNKSNNTLTNFQKNQLKGAVELYINNTCVNPINSLYVCEFATTEDLSGNIIVSGGSISLENFLEKGYINSEGVLSKCSGNIYIDNNIVDVSEIEC